jgi:hypothetical protein
MVTKGYQEGVYDRVTEGTWERDRFGKGQGCGGFKCGGFKEEDSSGGGAA